MAERQFVELLTPKLLGSFRKRPNGYVFKLGEPNFLGTPIKLTDRYLLAELLAVLLWCLKTIVWTKDLQTRGMREHWGLPIFVNGRWRGDCDDFMATFRLILMMLSWPEQALRRVVCWVPQDGEESPPNGTTFNHAVLGVLFEVKGTWRMVVLDNRRNILKSAWVLFKNFGHRNFRALSATTGRWRMLGFKKGTS